MKLTLTGYDQWSGNYRASDEAGRIHHVDIMVDATLPRPEYGTKEEFINFCKSLVGRQIVVKCLTPYVEIAHGVSLIEGEPVIVEDIPF